MGVLAQLALARGFAVSAPAIEVTEASLAFRLSRSRAGTLKEAAIQMMKSQLNYEQLWALKGVSFEVPDGEVLGVIGPNGAGKSTLMKMLARVLPPTEGRVVVRGTVAPMIELGAGFNTEMTAFENIVMYGALLGRRPEYMRERAEEIAHWADLDDFIDVPLRSYSSGMLARLGFSVATDTEPDVLIVDEVLSVGDAAFQQKSAERMERMIAEGASVVLVSHNMSTVLDIADRVIWLDHGLIKMVGDPVEIVAAYEASVG